MKIFQFLLPFVFVTHLVSAQVSFSEQAASWGINTGGTKDGGHSFADYDRDGDLDLLVNTSDGTMFSRLYRNNGNNT